MLASLGLGVRPPRTQARPFSSGMTVSPLFLHSQLQIHPKTNFPNPAGNNGCCLIPADTCSRYIFPSYGQGGRRPESSVKPTSASLRAEPGFGLHSCPGRLLLLIYFYNLVEVGNFITFCVKCASTSEDNCVPAWSGDIPRSSFYCPDQPWRSLE